MQTPRLENEPEMAIVSFYSFIEIEDLIKLQHNILLTAKKQSVKGTILLAKEGFNGSLSGVKSNVETVLQELISITAAKDVIIAVNSCNKYPFSKLKVKIKKEIITMGVGPLNVAYMKGDYVEAKDWDKFVEAEDVVVIDTRNHYEVEVGSFKDAINPFTLTFRDLPAWAEQNKASLHDKKIAMYCTGGVRCEKSTAYMRLLGFNEVYHLKGGILRYLEDTGNPNKKWNGKCFVFDDRRAVDTELKPAEDY